MEKEADYQITYSTKDGIVSGGVKM